MTLVLGNYTKEEAMMYACLSAQIKSEEAIDVVLLERTPEEELWRGKQQTKYIPFNPNDKYTVAFVKETDSGKQYRLMKGAPQVPPLLLDSKPATSPAHSQDFPPLEMLAPATALQRCTMLTSGPHCSP